MLALKLQLCCEKPCSREMEQTVTVFFLLMFSLLYLALSGCMGPSCTIPTLQGGHCFHQCTVNRSQPQRCHMVSHHQLTHVESGLQVWSNLVVQVHHHCASLGGFYIMVHQQRVRLCSGKRLHSGLKSARKRPKGATHKVEPAIPAWTWRRLSRQSWKLVAGGWSLHFPSHGKTIYFSTQGISGVEEEHVACPSSYSMTWMSVWLHLVTCVSKDFIIKEHL